MALLDPDFTTDGQRQFWLDELENAKRLLHEIEKAILFLTRKTIETGGIQEYTIDTGQDRQTVKRADLPSLYVRQKELLGLVAMLENRTRHFGGAVRVHPW